MINGIQSGDMDMVEIGRSRIFNQLNAALASLRVIQISINPTMAVSYVYDGQFLYCLLHCKGQYIVVYLRILTPFNNK